MKNIFIVTDFSDASQNAGRYGIELAKHFDANVFLFHAYQAPLQIPESYLFYNTEDVWEAAKVLMKKESELINPNNLVNLEMCGEEGDPANTIIKEAAKRKADVIICAMKGKAKVFRKIFGSTTSSLIGKSNIPLIIVPDDASFRVPKNIALASDIDPRTAPATVVLLQELGEKFVSRLSIVWVVDGESKVDSEMRLRPAGFINQLKSLNPVLEFPAGSSISKTLDIFVKEHDINLLAMIPHKHDMLERFFIESATRNMVFHTEIPLLLLPQQKNEEPGTGYQKTDSQNSMII